MKFNESRFLILVACAILGFLLTSQISFGKSGSSKIYTYQSYQQAVSELNKLNSEISILSGQKKNLDSKLHSISNQTTSQNIKQFEEDLNNYDFNEGLSDVKGPGVIITVEDSSAVNLDEYLLDNQYLLLVHNGDLNDLVWELKNQGAEAISINGQRIISSTEISCIGTMIKVNGIKLSSPFEIKAIGDQAKLSFALEKDDSIYKQFQDRRLGVNYVSSSSVIIRKYSNNTDYKYAKPVNE